MGPGVAALGLFCSASGIYPLLLLSRQSQTLLSNQQDKHHHRC
mgnify:CR=1 FL=1